MSISYRSFPASHGAPRNAKLKAVLQLVGAQVAGERLMVGQPHSPMRARGGL